MRIPFARTRRHLPLIWELVVRDAFGKYRGAALGALWALLVPLLMLAIYTIVFSDIFSSKWPSRPGTSWRTELSKAEFAAALYSGLLIYTFFADTLGRAPQLIISNANLVTKVIFPVELLALIPILSAFIHFILGFALLQAFQAIVLDGAPVMGVFAPFALIPVIAWAFAGTWLLSALGVYLRDISHTIGTVLTGLLFVSPIFFPSKSIPEKWQWLITFNPIASPIESFRNAVMFNEISNVETLAWSTALGTIAAYLAYRWFQSLKKGFGDVL